MCHRDNVVSTKEDPDPLRSNEAQRENVSRDLTVRSTRGSGFHSARSYEIEVARTS